MVFASAAARTTALASVLAEGMVTYLKDTDVVEIYTGAAWVSLDDPNAIQNSIVDAKGDLISATADNTPARLAVGNNGETLVADSSTSTGLRWNTPISLANPVINGGMDIWQRGTSISIPNGTSYVNGFFADRWQMNATGSTANFTVSRQSVGDTTNLPNIQYCARIQRNSGQTGTQGIAPSSSFETNNSIPFAGKTITFSFYARAGANYSATSNALGVNLVAGTGTDQNVQSGLTGQSGVVSQTATLTTTWQRFAYSATVGATATQLAAYFAFTPTGTAGTNDYFEVTGVQIDLGTYTAATAPAFRRSQGTIQGELAACQRYYYRAVSDTAYGSVAPYAVAASSSGFISMIQPPVTMRVSPTSIDFSTLAFVNYADTLYAASSLTLPANNNKQVILVSGSMTGATAGHAGRLTGNNSTAAYLGFSAEL
jgi:hypothetical protein